MIIFENILLHLKNRSVSQVEENIFESLPGSVLFMASYSSRNEFLKTLWKPILCHFKSKNKAIIRISPTKRLYIFPSGGWDTDKQSSYTQFVCINLSFSHLTAIHWTKGELPIYGIDHIQQWKMQEMWDPIHVQNYGTILFRRDFQTLNTRAARTALSSNVHYFCKPKFSCFTPVKRILFFPGIFDVV